MLNSGGGLSQWDPNEIQAPAHLPPPPLHPAPTNQITGDSSPHPHLPSFYSWPSLSQLMLRWIPGFKNNRGLGLVGRVKGLSTCPPHKLLSPWQSSPGPRTDCSSCLLSPAPCVSFIHLSPPCTPSPPLLPSTSPLCLTLHRPLYFSPDELSASPSCLWLGPHSAAPLTPHSWLCIHSASLSTVLPPSPLFLWLPLLGFLSLCLFPTPWRRNDPQTPPQRCSNDQAPSLGLQHPLPNTSLLSTDHPGPRLSSRGRAGGRQAGPALPSCQSQSKERRAVVVGSFCDSREIRNAKRWVQPLFLK